MKNYINPEKISLKNHPEYNEKWVQQIIANDPTILGLGDLVLKDQERIQPHAGRLDLLLQDTETNRRYEVELQLGRVDESHIIRTIEYWDSERKRYPNYDHCAVIIAEDVTSRFLNILSLFNGNIPLIAIQMNALSFEGKIALVFTTVLDELLLGLEDEDEVKEVTDRAYWENKGSKLSVGIVDKILELVKVLDPAYELKYNKFYIGLSKNGITDNFVLFRARKQHIQVEIKLKKTEEIDNKLDEIGIDLLEYNKRDFRYKVKIVKSDVEKFKETLEWLFKLAHDNTHNS